MQEKVDRILNGEVVDIAKDDGDYFLNVLKDDNRYKIGFMSSLYNKEYGSCLTVEMIKEAGELLSALADELESRKRFKDGDEYFVVCPSGEIYNLIFSQKYAAHFALLAMGNAFKTKTEAEANKDAILAKYQDLRDRGLV